MHIGSKIAGTQTSESSELGLRPALGAVSHFRLSNDKPPSRVMHRVRVERGRTATKLTYGCCCTEMILSAGGPRRNCLIDLLEMISWCSLWKGGFGTNPPSGGPAESINKSTHSNHSNHLCRPPSLRARARASAPLRPAPGASEDRSAHNNLSICHRSARPFRRAP